MTDEKADKIITLLEKILQVLSNPADLYESKHPWTLKIITEYTSGIDQDGNGRVYGHDFIFLQDLKSHPVALKSLATELEEGWAGPKMSFIEYYETLDDEHQKNQVMDYMKMIKKNAK